MQTHPLGTRVHFDQVTFMARVSHHTLHAALADAFGGGKSIHRDVNGRKQVGMAYCGTSIWASYMNKHGYCWLAMPGTDEYLSILGILAHTNKIRFRLYTVELAFDIPCYGATYAEAEIMLCRLAYRIMRINCYRAEPVRFFGDAFKHCNDKTVNGKKTFYIQTVDRHRYKQTGKKSQVSIYLQKQHYTARE